MNEHEKLKEADYFLGRMTEVQDDHEALKYNVSAFLSACRSVFQYAYKETNLGRNPGAKPEAQKWYEDTVTSSDVLKFFTGIRDNNIHDSPVEISVSINIISAVLGVYASMLTTVNEKNLPAAPPKRWAELKSEGDRPATSLRATFPDWSGPEDVFQLCTKYLEESQKFVEDGISKGYLS